MVILRITAYYNPEKVSSSHLFNDLEKALIKDGHELIIITPNPSRNVDKSTINKYRGKEKQNEWLFGNKLRVIRFKLFSEPKNVLLRALRYFLSVFKQYLIASKLNNIDVILIDSTPPIQGIIGAKLSNKKKIPFIYILQDIFPDSLINTGMINNQNILWKIGRKIENYTYKNASNIIVISQSFKSNIISKGVTEDKVYIIENWIDTKKIRKISKNKNYLFEKYNIDKGKFIISYCGNLGHTQNLEMVISAARSLISENMHFVFLGDGYNKDNLVKQAISLNNISFIPFQPNENISEVYSLGDLGLIVSKKNIGNNSVPSKVFTMMSAEQPILASFDEDSELSNLLKLSQAGFCITPENEELFVEKIREIYTKQNELMILGENGRKYVESHHSKNVNVSKYLKVLSNYRK